jgi:hypothetical protein
MSDKIIERMQSLFGEAIADPDVFPKIFLYQVKLAKTSLDFDAYQAQNKKS